MNPNDMTLGQIRVLSRQQAEEIEDEDERAAAHAALARRGACCWNANCFNAATHGSICGPCAREEEREVNNE